MIKYYLGEGSNSMRNIVYDRRGYIIVDTGSDLVVVNTLGEYSNHAHFKRRTDRYGNVNLHNAKMCIHLALEQIYPKNHLMRKAVLRVSTDEEFKAWIIRRAKSHAHYH